ncbi:MAG: MFS transporter [Actinomycetota bacterium]|nr:MFS transporter [Actinomycetota bacterium]
MALTTDRAIAEHVTLRAILADRYIGPIIGLVFLVLAGLGVVFPVMPLFVRSFGVGYDGVGVFIGAFGFMRLFGDLIGGAIVDRKGERWTAVAGMALLAVCATATGLAPNYALALMSWAIAGVGSAVSFAALFSYVVKVAPKDRVGRVLSFFYGAFNVGVIAGGAVGGLVAARFGLAAPLFIYTGILVFAAAFYVPRFIPTIEQAPVEVPLDAARAEGLANEEAPLPSKGPIRTMMRLPGFVTALVLNLIYLWMVGSVFNTLLSLFAQDELGVSTAGIGGLFALAVAAEFLILFPAGAWADRFGRRAVLVPALAALTISLAATGFATSVWMLAVFLVLLSIAGGFAGVPPAAMISDVVPEQQSGRAIGAFRFFGDLGFFFGPLIAGATSKSFGFRTAFIVTAIPSAIGLVLTLRTAETLQEKNRGLAR